MHSFSMFKTFLMSFSLSIKYLSSQLIRIIQRKIEISDLFNFLIIRSFFSHVIFKNFFHLQHSTNRSKLNIKLTEFCSVQGARQRWCLPSRVCGRNEVWKRRARRGGRVDYGEWGWPVCGRVQPVECGEGCFIGFPASEGAGWATYGHYVDPARLMYLQKVGMMHEYSTGEFNTAILLQSCIITTKGIVPF